MLVLSADLKHLQDLVSKNLSYEFLATIEFDESEVDALEKLVTRIGEKVKTPVLAVVAGAETGVNLADALSERLGLRTNGVAQSEARRDKYVMGETVRAAGVRAVKQMMSSNLDEIKAYIEEWNPSPFQVILKPVNSAGSDGVTLCGSMEEVESTFRMLFGKTNGIGLSNLTVLVQEYLTGIEYVVDCVSMDGVHKCVAVWEYDRRAINGAGFVCMGQRLLCDDEEIVQQLVDYQFSVLDALGIKEGPSHGEIKWHQGAPVLVEVGARCHGAEGLWVPLEDAVYGYNQVDLTCSLYLNRSMWDDLPVVPHVRKNYCNMLFVVSFKGGIVEEVASETLAEIQAMPSYHGIEMFVNAGSKVEPTTDCFSWLGNVQLVHR